MTFACAWRSRRRTYGRTRNTTKTDFVRPRVTKRASRCRAGSQISSCFRNSDPEHVARFRRGHMMKLPRRQFLRLAASAAAVPAVWRIASAQAYPSRPITIVVPSGAGGPSDVIVRIVAERMRSSLGQPLVIENVTGANGSLGTGRVARANPDGYTLAFSVSFSTHVVNGVIYALPYDVINDFEPVALVADAPLVILAKKAIPANDLKELIECLKANPDRASL